VFDNGKSFYIDYQGGKCLCQITLQPEYRLFQEREIKKKEELTKLFELFTMMNFEKTSLGYK
jgi:hypothetical protein